jgi:hypothetical protein
MIGHRKLRMPNSIRQYLSMAKNMAAFVMEKRRATSPQMRDLAAIAQSSKVNFMCLAATLKDARCAMAKLWAVIAARNYIRPVKNVGGRGRFGGVY